MNDGPMVIFVEREAIAKLGPLPSGKLQIELKDGRLVTLDVPTLHLVSAFAHQLDREAIGARALAASLIPPPEVQARLRATEECPDAAAVVDPRFHRGGRA